MRREIGRAVAAVVIACCIACESGDGAGAIARFEVEGAAPLAWSAAPFPGDFRLAEDGTVALGELPTARTGTPLFDRIRALLAARRGFCATCAVYFPIDGALDRASVPMATTGEASDAIVLVDVDPESPERGRFVPLRVEWNEALGVVALRPARGIALASRRRYAAALTSALRASDGSALGSPASFAGDREGMIAGLVEAGVDAERIAIATTFTTEDVLADLRGARAATLAAPLPVVTVDRVWHEGEELDALLGVPAEDRPGIDVAPSAGTEGTRALRHGGIALVVAGRLTAPRLLTGEGTDVGELRREAGGAIAAGPLEDVPFVLSIPSGAASLDALPLVVHHHGFNASRTTGFAIAETAARAGFALLSIDAYQHGERAASARDELFAMRGEGVPGADGFAETSLLDVSARVFALSGVPRGDELFPGYPMGAFVQFASDVVASIRMAQQSDLAPLRDADPALATLAFDPARVCYAGNSMGSVVGTSVLAIEPSIRCAVLNVPPGAIVENLVESPEFRSLTHAAILPRLGVDPGAFDEIERHLVLDPIVDLFRWALEPVDPLALAPHLLTPGDDGVAPIVLFQPAALDEVASPLATTSFLEAAGATRVTRYDPAGHGMLEVRDQVSEYEPPYELPLTTRPSPLPIANPLAAIHDEITAFLAAP